MTKYTQQFFSILLLVIIPVLSGAQTTDNKEKAFEIAQRKDIPVLLVFSGSDWCRPCIRLKKEILDTPAFQSFANDRFVTLIADFPQKKELSAAQSATNSALAEKYNPDGAFPHLVLLDKNSRQIATIQYRNQTAEEFIAGMKRILPQKTVLKAYRKQIPVMGSFFEFIIVDSVTAAGRAWGLIEKSIKEVQRIDNLISEWKPASQVSQINKNAGISPIQVDVELYQLIARSKEIGRLTQGAFDISFLPLNDIWHFNRKNLDKPFDTIAILKQQQKVDYRKIQLLDSNYVFLPEKGMAIGFGGIGQGYAVDRVKEMLLKAGATDFVVNSSGDVYSHGHNQNGEPWQVAIMDPFDKEKMIRWLQATNIAVVTSGDYEKFFLHNGRRYGHIINPKTGFPVQGIVSTTVINPITEIADALATSLFVLGKDVGLDLINQLPGTECIIVDDNKNIYYSKGLEQ